MQECNYQNRVAKIYTQKSQFVYKNFRHLVAQRIKYKKWVVANDHHYCECCHPSVLIICFEYGVEFPDYFMLTVKKLLIVVSLFCLFSFSLNFGVDVLVCNVLIMDMYN